MDEESGKIVGSQNWFNKELDKTVKKDIAKKENLIGKALTDLFGVETNVVHIHGKFVFKNTHGYLSADLVGDK